MNMENKFQNREMLEIIRKNINSIMKKTSHITRTSTKTMKTMPDKASNPLKRKIQSIQRTTQIRKLVQSPPT